MFDSDMSCHKYCHELSRNQRRSQEHDLSPSFDFYVMYAFRSITNLGFWRNLYKVPKGKFS